MKTLIGLTLFLTSLAFGQINVTRTNCPTQLLSNQIIVVQSIVTYQGTVTMVLACYQLDTNFTIDNGTSPPTLKVSGSGGGGSSPLFVDNEVPSGSVNGSNNNFTVAHTPITGSVKVYRNGLRMKPTVDYTITGATISFLETPLTGDLLLADYRY